MDVATGRDAQRDETRRSIVDAAVTAFAERGFAGTSTRTIARRAGISQGLVTYHFPSKDDLWRAAVESVFAALDASLAADIAAAVDAADTDDLDEVRLVVRAFVGFSARHPELFQLMVDAGRHDDDRMRWIVDHHLRHRFDGFVQLAGIAGGADEAHVYYALIGASSLMSAVAPECRHLTGVDPLSDEAIRRHADLVTDLILAPAPGTPAES